jgi:hypothetical protein
MDKLYDRYDNTKTLHIINQALDDLEGNSDIKELTSRYYIAGYIMDCLDKNNLLLEKFTNE